MKKFLILQSLLLFFGTFFAWYTVVNDFFRFLYNYGSNPLATPCFYGAIGFLVAYIYSLFIYFTNFEKRKKHQKILVIFLIVGTIFGWSNFILELCMFYIFNNPTTCSGASSASPFLTACFYGSVIYLLSLISSLLAFKNLKINSKK